MKIYLAAPYGKMSLMQTWRDLLELNGHVVIAKWIDGNEEGMTPSAAAQMDLDDIDAVDAVVSLTLLKGTLFSSGGRHVEFGYGLARGKLMIIVDGGIENVFHHLKTVLKCTDIQEVVKVLALAPLQTEKVIS